MQLPFQILVAEDDPDDQMLLRRALISSGCPLEIKIVEDGEELLKYLSKENEFGHVPTISPHLILLDLNLPKKDGRDALRELKTNKRHRTIPVVVFTTSDADVDISMCYNLGVNAYITKPVRYDELIRVIHSLVNFWCDTATVPC